MQSKKKITWKKINLWILSLIAVLIFICFFYSVSYKFIKLQNTKLPYLGNPSLYVSIFACLISVFSLRYTYYQKKDERKIDEEQKEKEEKISQAETKNEKTSEENNERLEERLNEIQDSASKAMVMPFLTLNLKKSVFTLRTYYGIDNKENKEVGAKIYLKNIGDHPAISLKLVPTSDRDYLYDFVDLYLDYVKLASPMSQTFVMPNMDVSFNIVFNINRLLDKRYNPNYEPQNSKRLSSKIKVVVKYTDVIGREYLQMFKLGYVLHFDKINYQYFKKGEFWIEQYSFPPKELKNNESEDKQIKDLLEEYMFQ